MSELRKTSIFVGVALVLMGLVAVSGLVGRASTDASREIGLPLFPNFVSPEQATTLQVADFDAETGQAFPFEVTLKDGRWVIPSHYNYPADARDRLAKTAAGVIDLVRDTYRGNNAADHRAMGVLDPLSGDVSSAEGLGKRVTMKDASGQVLADLIVGSPIEGQPDQRYARLPSENAVYGVRLGDLDLSPRFTDWIETDLLKLTPSGVREVVFQKFSFDAASGELKGKPITAHKADVTQLAPGAPAWTIDQEVPPGREVNATALDTLVSTLAGLRILGVRPKPPNLSADLKAGDGSIQMDPATLNSLRALGFVILDGVLVSKEGSVYIACDDGVVYNLHFGTMTYGRGSALTSGKRGDEVKEALEKPAGVAENENFIESRYLFVLVRHSPELIEKPKSREPGELPDDVFAREKFEREAMNQRAEQEAKAKQANYDRKLEEGRKRAKELRERFAGWYYIVPGDSFRKVVLDPSVLTRVKSAQPPNGMPGQFPGGFPGGRPNLPGFPPGQ